MNQRRLAPLALCVIFIACAGEDVTIERTADAILTEPLPDGNTFACTSCHAIEEPPADGIRRAGHQIGNAARRASYKNGQLTDLLDAVNTCVTEWMLAPAWTASDPEWITLRTHLEERAGTAEATPIEIQVVQPPADTSGGSPLAGRELFNTSCIGCHGQDGGGTVRAPGITGLALDTDYIARRIRSSGLTTSAVYDGLTGGRMPFWGADRLTDDELRDLAAFVSMADAPATGPTGPGPTTMGRECGSTHAKVGQTTTLSTEFHGVRGEARILDDCNIELTNFDYDGAGIDVRIYAGQNGNYDDGFAISGDLVKRGGYSGETIRLTLPEGRTLDEMNGISVWCVAVGVDFGSGSFR